MPDDSHVMDQRLGNIEGVLERIQHRAAEFSAQVDMRFEQVDTRFEQIDTRFEQIDTRFEQMDARLDRMDARFDRIDARFERMDARLDEMQRSIDERPTEAQVRTYFEALEGQIRLVYDVVVAMRDESARNYAEHQSFTRQLGDHDLRITALERKRPRG